MTVKKAIKIWRKSVGFNEIECSSELQDAIMVGMKSLEAWGKVKEEIKSSLITHGQVVEGEYFADDAESINYGLNKASEIIDKYLKEVEK